jgi:hypothetical protein
VKLRRVRSTVLLATGLVAGLLSIAAPATAATATATPATGTAATVGATPVLDRDGSSLPVARVGSSRAAAQPSAITRGATFDRYVSGVLVHFNTAYQWLDRGGSWTFGHARLSMQTDGNLVLYDNRNGTPRWASGTNGSGATQMLFQPDGNLVVYTAGYASAVWASHTDNKCDAGTAPLLGLQEDSNLVIYCGYVNSAGDLYVAPIWATNTSF